MDILGFFTGWKLAAVSAIGGAVVASSVAVWATSLPYETKIAKLERDYAVASAISSNNALTDYTAQAKQINLSALALLQSLPEYKNDFDRLSKELHNASINSPLPKSCAPTADRLRILTAAVARANAAAFGQ